MPEMSTKFVPKHKGDKNPNPKLLKFVRHVTDRVPGKIKMDTDAPEYWGLACIFEDEMDAVTREASLDLLLDMLPGNFFKVRKHHTYAELHEMHTPGSMQQVIAHAGSCSHACRPTPKKASSWFSIPFSVGSNIIFHSSMITSALVRCGRK